jgi:hypothetical protein
MPININGGSRRAAGWWGRHLENAETNERVEVMEISGLGATDIADAFAEMRALAEASGSKVKNFFYQYNINPRADEQLTEAQWQQAHATLHKNLGFPEDQPFFRVRHIKDGRVHEHGVIFRVDLERGVAVSDSLTARIHERTARELEITFDLERGKSILTPDRDFERPERRPKNHESFRAGETGIDPDTVKADARQAWERADSGTAFRVALEASGDYVLARGDRRDFVIIDRAGDDHSLARRVGEKAAAVRERMADLDPASVPNVEQAREMQRDRQQQREADAIDRQAEQAMQDAHAAAKGRTDKTRAPEEPIYDRDKAEADWQKALIDAAARQAEQDARAAAIGRIDVTRGPVEVRMQAEPTAGMETHGTEPQPVQTTSKAEREEVFSPPPSPQQGSAPDSGLRDPDNILTRMLGGIGKWFAGLFGGLGDSIAPPPPPTKDQVEAAERVAEQQQRAEQGEAVRRQAQESHDRLAEAERVKGIDRTLQVNPVAQPDDDSRFREIMRRAAREDERDRDRGYERER